MPIVLKSGSLNLLEPSGPVQVCDGIALPFTLDVGIIVECVRPAQLPVLTEVRAPSLLEHHPRYLPHRDRAGYNNGTITLTPAVQNVRIANFLHKYKLSIWQTKEAD